MNALLLVLLSSPCSQSSDYVVPAGTTRVHDTAAGPLRVRRFVLEPGSILRVVGARPLVLWAKEADLEGTLDLSGFAAQAGDPAAAPGAAGGGSGGSGGIPGTRPPQGSDGNAQHRAGGGRGGESGIPAGSLPDMAPPGLYPEIEPFHSERLAVSSRHTLYFEQCGNPKGAPVLFVHGGPGAGCSTMDRRFFDPRALRVVLVDQRGAGRSTPLGELAENTIEDLVADFERIRARLGIERWHVFGGSWGSTLGLYYAERHPERVLSLCLRGIWLLRQLEVDWWFYGLRALAPELWRAFAEHLPEERRNDLLNGYWELFHSRDEAVARAAAKAWATYEGAACTLLPNPEFLALLANDTTSWALARLEAHYLRNQRFTPDDRLLRDLHRVREIPAFLVHGRYDLVCPLVGADDLHRAWPEASYVVVDDAGHSSHEPGIARELVAAMDRVARTGSPVIPARPSP